MGVRAMLLVAGVLMGAAGCGSDFEDAPVSLERADHGWLVSIEPNEPFDVGLVGNARFPDLRWRLAEVDDTIVGLEATDHARLRADVENLTGDERVTITMFFLRGLEIGETALAFELARDDGVVIAVTQFTIAVVDDPCATEVGLVANRCGGVTDDRPDALTELDHGWLVALEPGDTVDVVLTGNASFPVGAWELVPNGSAAVDVAGPVRHVADRVPGDWSRGGSPTFLPRSTFTVTGLDIGRSRLEFNFTASGETIDRYSVTFDVVADACAATANQSTCGK